MHITLQLNDTQKPYRPGQMISGSVTLFSSEPCHVESVELRGIPDLDEIPELHGTLATNIIVDGEQTLPVAIRIPQGKRSAITWEISIEARCSKIENARIEQQIVVESSTATKIGEGITAMFFSLLFMAVGLAGIYFGIYGAPQKVVPEGVLWFAFAMGIGALLVARAILGARERGSVQPWLGVPITIILAAIGIAALYLLFTFAFVLIYGPDTVRSSLFLITSGSHSRACIMLLLVAGFALPVAAGVMSRRPVTATLQADIALTVTSVTVLLILLGGIAASYFTLKKMPSIAAEAWILSLFGAIAVWPALRRPTWTAAPTVTAASGIVPLVIGVAWLFNSFAAMSASAMVRGIEQATSAMLILWGATIIYRGARNVMVALSTASVNVTLRPATVQIGSTFAAVIQLQPHTTVTLKGISGTLRCERYHTRTVDTDRSTSHETLHLDRRQIQLNEQLRPEYHVHKELPFIVPIGLPRSESGSSNGVTWSLDIIIHFAGRPDWAESLPVKVT